MNILGVTCGRRMGNSEVLLKESLMGAEEVSGADAEIIRLTDLGIKPCKGCAVCMMTRVRTRREGEITLFPMKRRRRNRAFNVADSALEEEDNDEVSG